MKLAVCWIWSSPFVYTAFCNSMLRLERPAGYDVRFIQGMGWGPARRHTDACEKALEWGADLILILGSDQIYEPDLLCRLTKRWEEGCEVISAMVPSRGYISWQPMRPFQPAVYRFVRHDGVVPLRPYRGLRQDGDMIEMVERTGQVEKINMIGSGVLMFHRDHLEALKRPWFFESVDHETQTRFANMDSTFVWRLQSEADANVWCDTGIQVRHLHIFEIDDSYQERFADLQRPPMDERSAPHHERNTEGAAG